MMKRLNFTLDSETVDLLNNLAKTCYGGNKSRAVRAALESLATRAGHDGWVISGYTPIRLEGVTCCHTCGKEHLKGEMLYKPVFERGTSASAMSTIPGEAWLECSSCVETKL